jgi:sugar O-acyltransferase (sialic acid O-acetyltransferase NeuD family)
MFTSEIPPRTIVVFGAGDIAKLAHFYFSRDSDFEVTAFTVDREFLSGEEFCGLPVCPADELVARYPPDTFGMFVALSYRNMNRLRMTKYAAMRDAGYRLVTYVSSRCTYLSESRPGDNCFILEDNTIQPFVTVGNNVTMWSGNHIGHDSIIEDHCFISSHVVVSGHVRVGERSFLGVNATLRNAISIAPGTLVGAGAAIMRDTKPNEVYLPPAAKIYCKSSEDVAL